MIRLLLVFLACIAGLHVVAYFRNAYGGPLWVSSRGTRPRFFDFLRRSSGTRSSERAEEVRHREMYLLWMFAAMAILLLYFAAVLTLRFRWQNVPILSLDNAEDLGFALLATLSLALVGVTVLDVALSLISPASPQHRKTMRLLLRWEVFVPASLVAGGVTFASLAYLVGKLSAYPAAIFLLRRTALTEYELSPLMPLLLLGSIAYLWGLFNLRRQQLLHERPSLALPRLGPPALAENLTQKLNELGARLRAFPLAMALGVVVLGGAVTWPVFGRLTTLEFHQVTWLFKALLIGAVVLIVFTTVRFWIVWRLLRDALTILKHHPLTESLGRLPDRLAQSLGRLLLEEVPLLTDAAIHKQQLHVLFSALPKHRDAALMVALGTSSDRTSKALVELQKLGKSWPPGDPSDPHAVQSVARDAARHLAQLLEDSWDHPPVRHAGEGPLPEGKLPCKDTLAPYLQPPADAVHLWLRLAEEVVAMQVVSLLHTVFPHLRNALLFLVASLLLLLTALNSYPFEPVQWATVLVWLLFLGVIGLATQAMFQMNRNTVLSRLTGTDPGKINWDLGFVKQLALYVLLPLISLVSTQFSAFSWLGRLLQNVR
jgi:hypothetical protein